MAWASTVEATLEAEYDCKHCDYRCPCLVKSKGAGRGGNVDAAYADGFDDAGDEAADTLMYIVCPNCGKVDDYGARYKVGIAVNTLLIWLGSLVLMYLTMAMKGMELGSSFGLGVILFFSTLCAGLYFGKKRRAWSSAQARVRFA